MKEVEEEACRGLGVSLTPLDVAKSGAACNEVLLALLVPPYGLSCAAHAQLHVT